MKMKGVNNKLSGAIHLCSLSLYYFR